jgi:hypothetical protein
MDGKTLRQRRAPQVIRCFAPTRLADDLLAGIYDRLLAAGTPHSGGQSPARERVLQKLLLSDHQAMATGGRS